MLAKRTNTFLLWDLRLRGDRRRRRRRHQQVLEVLLEDKSRSYNLVANVNTSLTGDAPTLFSLVTMNFSTLCCLILNILEPLLLSRESSSSITSLGVLILVPRSSSEASGSDSSSDRTMKTRTVKSSSPQPSHNLCQFFTVTVTTEAPEESQ